MIWIIDINQVVSSVMSVVQQLLTAACTKTVCKTTITLRRRSALVLVHQIFVVSLSIR